MALVSVGTRVMFLGDDEFDGIGLQKTVNDLSWGYACHTAKSTKGPWRGEQFNLDALGDWRLPF